MDRELTRGSTGSERRPGTALRLTHVGKSFPGVQAVADVDLVVWPGETVGVVGENGAGKSTLMKIISGVYPAGSYEGELAVADSPRRFRNVRDAETAGVVLVPQELYVAPGLSVAENMFMNRLPGRFGFLDGNALREMTRERLRFFNIEIEPDAPAGLLSPSEQRLVTIASALSKSAKLIILDEPTAALTESEARRLYSHIRRVCAEGVACLYISHRLDEIEQIADRVVVMRNGQVTARFDQAKGKTRQIVQAMIGRDPESAPARRLDMNAEPILRAENLTLRDPHDPGRIRVDRASFALHRGEILGLFGLVGAGRTELAQAIFGAWPGAIDGAVRIEEREARPASPREAIAAGIGMLTENRKRTGLMEGQSVMFNMSAASIDAVCGALFVDQRREFARNGDLARSLDLRPFNLAAPVEAFSGGNQQKVLLARWLATNPRMLILDEPTLGVDIGARFELYRLIRRLADEGRAVLMISSDLKEVIDECDRILTMYKGRITGEFDHGASRLEIMAAATGEGRGDERC
jgi:ABC-type sugar transport system ATPase subunit